MSENSLIKHPTIFNQGYPVSHEIHKLHDLLEEGTHVNDAEDTEPTLNNFSLDGLNGHFSASINDSVHAPRDAPQQPCPFTDDWYDDQGWHQMAYINKEPWNYEHVGHTSINVDGELSHVDVLVAESPRQTDYHRIVITQVSEDAETIADTDSRVYEPTISIDNFNSPGTGSLVPNDTDDNLSANTQTVPRKACSCTVCLPLIWPEP
jgi:hypothetical protein